MYSFYDFAYLTQKFTFDLNLEKRTIYIPPNILFIFFPNLELILESTLG